MSASWFLVSMYLIWILGSELIPSNNQSRATLWVLETCLIEGLLPFLIILITASLSSITYNKASLREEFTFEGRKSTLFRSSIFSWFVFRVGDLYGSPRTWSFWCVFPWRTVTIKSHKSSAGIPSILNPASKDCWTVRNSSLFLTHPADWNKCMIFKNAQWSTLCRFWILKISRKIGVLKQSQSVMFRILSHMTILFVFTCVMNVGDQTW